MLIKHLRCGIGERWRYERGSGSGLCSRVFVWMGGKKVVIDTDMYIESSCSRQRKMLCESLDFLQVASEFALQTFLSFSMQSNHRSDYIESRPSFHLAILCWTSSQAMFFL